MQERDKIKSPFAWKPVSIVDLEITTEWEEDVIRLTKHDPLKARDKLSSVYAKNVRN